MSLQSFALSLLSPKYKIPVNWLFDVPMSDPSVTSLVPIVILSFTSLALVTLLSAILSVVIALSEIAAASPSNLSAFIMLVVPSLFE